MAAERLQDPLLGLRLGQSFAPRHAGVIAHVLAGCGTIGEALEHYSRFEPLFYGAHLAWMGPPSTSSGAPTMARPSPLVAECAIAALHRFAVEALGRDAVALEEVGFVHRAPADLAPYERTFRCVVRFGRDASRSAPGPRSDSRCGGPIR